MSFTQQQLATEIDNDPQALGYATLLAQTNGPEAVAGRLNEAGASGETLFKSYVAIEDVLAAIVATEFNSLTAAQKTACDMFLRGDRVKSGDANLRTTIAGLFAGGTTSRANLIALASRAASRAEALWGEGTVVSAQDVGSALEL